MRTFTDIIYILCIFGASFRFIIKTTNTEDKHSFKVNIDLTPAYQQQLKIWIFMNFVLKLFPCLCMASCLSSRCQRGFSPATCLTQKQVHLEFSNPSTHTAPHSESKRDGAKGIGPIMAITEPPLRLKGERLRERFFIVADGVVRKRESCLGKP